MQEALKIRPEDGIEVGGIDCLAVQTKDPETAPSGHGRARIPLSRKLKWLSNMLWGGSALLLFEHIWHGEVVPWFPFLTAMSDRGDTAEMFHEMATVGVGMAVMVTAAWVVICIAAEAILARPEKAVPESTL